MAKDRDFAVNALRVVEQAIGERMDGSPLSKAVPKSDRAVARGRLGGPARAVKLLPAARKAIAVKGAQARWGKPRKSTD